jgi:hypothetical protein
MIPSKFPKRKCREHVQATLGRVFLCEVPVDNMSLGHDGPCATYDVKHTIANRRRWEDENDRPHWNESDD